jgi:hypothetical protein
MKKREIASLEGRIAALRKRLAGLGPMRPGSISKQYRDRESRKGLYYQLSYTHQMQSLTEHEWPEHVKALKMEQAEYKKHKKMTGELIDLSIELSKAKIACLRQHSPG